MGVGVGQRSSLKTLRRSEASEDFLAAAAVRLSATQRGRPRRTSDPRLGCRGLQHRVIHPASTPQGADASLPSGLGPTHGKIHIIYFLRLQLHAPPLTAARAYHAYPLGTPVAAPGFSIGLPVIHMPQPLQPLRKREGISLAYFHDTCMHTWHTYDLC